VGKTLAEKFWTKNKDNKELWLEANLTFEVGEFICGYLNDNKMDVETLTKKLKKQKARINIQKVLDGDGNMTLKQLCKIIHTISPPAFKERIKLKIVKI